MSDLSICPKCNTPTAKFRHLNAKVWCPQCGFVLRAEGGLNEIQTWWTLAERNRELIAKADQLRKEKAELVEALEKAAMYLPSPGVPVGFDHHCDKLISKHREVDQ